MRCFILLAALLTSACQTIPTAKGISREPVVTGPDPTQDLELALCAVGAAGVGLAYRSLRRGLLG